MALNEYTRVRDACVLISGPRPTPPCRRHTRVQKKAPRNEVSTRIRLGPCAPTCARAMFLHPQRGRWGRNGAYEWRNIMTKWLALSGITAMLAACANVDGGPVAAVEEPEVDGQAGAAQLGYHGPVR